MGTAGKSDPDMSNAKQKRGPKAKESIEQKGRSGECYKDGVVLVQN